MPPEREMLPDRSEAREKRLGTLRVAKPAQAPLTFARRLMAILGPVVQAGGSLDEHVFDIYQRGEPGLCGRIAAQLIGDDFARQRARPKYAVEESLGCVAPLLQQNIEFGAQEFVDLDNDALEDVGGVDLVFDVIGGDIGKRSAGLVRAGGAPVSVVGPPEVWPNNGLAIDFVVESDRARLHEIVQRVRDGRLRTNVDNIAPLDDAVAAFKPTKRISRKTIIRVRP